MNGFEEIMNFTPGNEQEESDKQLMIEYINDYKDTILTRDNKLMHMTSSSMIFNRELDKVLMIYHNIYDSWSWTGGHADGDNNFFQVALKEAQEETGIKQFTPVSTRLQALDILPVPSHMKNNQFISTHLHLNTTYFFMADEKQPLIVKPDENSGVKWIAIHDLIEYISEPLMIPVYQKLLDRIQYFH